MWGVNTCNTVYREYSYESVGERILKIGLHLPKLLTNVKWLTFLRHRLNTQSAGESKYKDPETCCMSLNEGLHEKCSEICKHPRCTKQECRQSDKKLARIRIMPQILLTQRTMSVINRLRQSYSVANRCGLMRKGWSGTRSNFNRWGSSLSNIGSSVSSVPHFQFLIPWAHPKLFWYADDNVFVELA